MHALDIFNLLYICIEASLHHLDMMKMYNYYILRTE